MDLLTPRRSSNSALPLHTQKQCTARGGLPSQSLTTKGSWIHLSGEGRQASRQLFDASAPPFHVMTWLLHLVTMCWLVSCGNSCEITISFCLKKTSLYVACLGGSSDWDTVRTDRDCLLEELGSCSDFRGACSEINYSGRQRVFDGVLYNLSPLANIGLSDAQ